MSRPLTRKPSSGDGKTSIFIVSRCSSQIRLLASGFLLVGAISASATQDVTYEGWGRQLSSYAYDNDTAFSDEKPMRPPGDIAMVDDPFVSIRADISNIREAQAGDSFGIRWSAPGMTGFRDNLVKFSGSRWCEGVAPVYCYPQYYEPDGTWSFGVNISSTYGQFFVEVMNNGNIVHSAYFTVVGYKMAVMGGGNQSIRVSETTPLPIEVVLRYPDGAAVGSETTRAGGFPSKKVRFEITKLPSGTKSGGLGGTSAGGSVSTYMTDVDRNGVARVYLTAGSRAGTYVVTATSPVSQESVTVNVNVTGTDLSDSIDKEKSAGTSSATGTSGCGGAPADAVALSTDNPINIATGNKYRVETDYLGSGPFPLQLTRYYNHLSSRGGGFGAHWLSGYDSSINIRTIEGKGRNRLTTLADVIRGDGKVLTFTLVDSLWQADPDVADRLESLPQGGYQYTCSADHVEVYSSDGLLRSITSRGDFPQTLSYDAQGHLARVTDAFGRQLSFAYDGSGRITQVLDPAGQPYTYGYDLAGNLSSVQLPGRPARGYLYENAAFPGALTGITDENGARYATFTYDSKGRATSSQLADGAEFVKVSYFTDGTRVVTDGLGTRHTYTFSVIEGVPRRTGLSTNPCLGCAVSNLVTGYDAAGFVTSVTDPLGVTTLFTRNSRGLEIARTEAAGTADARTISTTWHNTFRLPATISEPGRTTSFSYDPIGRLESRTETATASNVTRTTLYAYGAEGLLIGIDGPRDDVSDETRFVYDAQGNLATKIDPLGRETHFTAYDAHGRLLSMTDPNGLITTYEYDPAGALVKQTVGSQITVFEYDGAGQLTRLVRPDGSWLSFSYDNAHRLIGVSDAAGNAVDYVLDPVGNVLSESVKDASGTLKRQAQMEYDALSRLQRLTRGDVQ